MKKLMKYPIHLQHKKPSQQKGVILLVTIIIMGILTLGAAAVAKSMNTSLSNAANLAFRRDLINQAELVFLDIKKRLELEDIKNLNKSDKNLNYSAAMISDDDVNEEGIPLCLFDTSSHPFSSCGDASNDYTEESISNSFLKEGLRGSSIRYLIERLCQEEHESSSGHCIKNGINISGGSQEDPYSFSGVVFRVNLMVTGPRGTQVFVQTTFDKPAN